jgi:hypothetical protein
VSQLLGRDDVNAGLAELSDVLAELDIEVTFHIVGGAAIMLTAHPDRRATNDVDTWINTLGDAAARRQVDAAVVAIARRRGWPDDWLNDKAQLFIPDTVGSDPGEWLPHSVTRRVRVVTGQHPMLLAMKLHAGRGHRDLPDLQPLIEACGYTTFAEIEACFEEHYPHEVMKPKSRAWLETNFPG